MATAHDFEFHAIDGGPLPLVQFKGKPILVVNTASKCGFTRQYAGLEALWSQYKDHGLVVLGVPANNFFGQEPGTDSQIAHFCSLTYGVDFPMTAKTDVVGRRAHPFYQWVKGALGKGGKPRWNFHKILIGKEGQPIAGFGSRTEPSAPELIRAIEAAL